MPNPTEKITIEAPLEVCRGPSTSWSGRRLPLKVGGHPHRGPGPGLHALRPGDKEGQEARAAAARCGRPQGHQSSSTSTNDPGSRSLLPLFFPTAECGHSQFGSRARRWMWPRYRNELPGIAGRNSPWRPPRCTGHGHRTPDRRGECLLFEGEDARPTVFAPLTDVEARRLSAVLGHSSTSPAPMEVLPQALPAGGGHRHGLNKGGLGAVGRSLGSSTVRRQTGVTVASIQRARRR